MLYSHGIHAIKNGCPLQFIDGQFKKYITNALKQIVYTRYILSLRVSKNIKINFLWLQLSILYLFYFLIWVSLLSNFIMDINIIALCYDSRTVQSFNHDSMDTLYMMTSSNETFFA